MRHVVAVLWWLWILWVEQTRSPSPEVEVDPAESPHLSPAVETVNTDPALWVVS